MPVYLMEVRTQVAVVADDIFDAHAITNRHLMRDVISDIMDENLDVDLLREIRSLEDLVGSGWDGMCIPYGDGDGNTRLYEMVPATPKG